MRYTPFLSLALGNVAFAQMMNSTSFTVPTQSPTPTPSPSPDNFPAVAGDFVFYGCVSSEERFPTFSLVASSDAMSIEFCAASCPSRFFGVYNTDCYCGDELDEDDSARVADSQCNTPCPGDDDEMCGGLAGSLRLARRQSVPLSVLLTVYIRTTGGDVTVTTTVSGTPTTITETAAPTSNVTNITNIYNEIVIICYGDYCTSDCGCGEHYRVVCQDDVCAPEKCDDEYWNLLVICDGDDCHYPTCSGDECNKKIVCYGDNCINESCYGDECQKKLVCTGDDCVHESCSGDDCYTKVTCTGDDCTVDEACTGDACPSPAAPTKAIATPTPSSCTGDDCSAVTTPTGSVVAGSSKMLPAFGIGAIAGLAFFL